MVTATDIAIEALQVRPIHRGTGQVRSTGTIVEEARAVVGDQSHDDRVQSL